MGLARIATDGSDAEATDLTSTGMVMGTAAYMSPEQARNTKNADARSDIYSVGCTLFFLLTGRPAYGGETIVDTIFAHASDPIPSLSNSVDQPIPPELEQLFRRMVAKQADDRFASMTEVITALESLPSGDALRVVAVSDEPQPSVEQFPGADHSQAVAASRDSDTSQAKQAKFVVAAIVVIAAALAWPLFSSPETGPEQTRESPGAGSSSRGFSLKFDGRSSYVAVPSLVPDPTKPVTLEVICEVDEFRTSNMISWLGPDWMALFIMQDGRFGVGRLVGAEPQLIRAETTAELGRSYHLAGQWDGSELSLFINGELAETRAMGFELPETDGGLYIGGVRPDLLPGDQNDRFFNGRIDAVRISYDVVYSERFSVPAQLEVGPETLVLYQFDEGSGTTTANSVSSEHAGTLTNTQWQAN